MKSNRRADQELRLFGSPRSRRRVGISDENCGS